MTIADILSELDQSEHPVARALHKHDHFKVLFIGFKKGMRLAEHTTKFPAKITVLQGSITYKEPTYNVTLNKYDERAIPVDVIHSVEALEDSLCLLTQGWDDKIIHASPQGNIGWDGV